MGSKNEETLISLNGSRSDDHIDRNAKDSDSDDVDDLFSDHSKVPADSTPIHQRALPPMPPGGSNGLSTSNSNERALGVQVVAGPSSSSSTSNDAVTLMPETELSQTQRVLVSAATKYAILGGFTIFFLVLQFAASAIYDLMETLNLEFQLILDLWFMTALFIVFWTIYISFPAATGRYEWCCRRLHNVTEQRFRRRMIEEIEYKDVTVLDMAQINRIQS